MSANVYGVTEIVGTSPNGIDAAIEVGIARASTTLRGLDWFEVTEVRGHINDGKVGCSGGNPTSAKVSGSSRPMASRY